MTRVSWLSYVDGERPEDKWDAQFVKDVFPASEATWSFDDHVPHDADVVVMPGGVHSRSDVALKFFKELCGTDHRVVVVITADEQTLFPVRVLEPLRDVVWRQTPRSLEDGDRLFGYMTPPDTRVRRRDKSVDAFFAGQVFSEERRRLLHVMRHSLSNCVVTSTSGFTRGHARDSYLEMLASAKYAPCPSGAATPDTFRLYEALQQGCVPVVLDHPYWTLLYGEGWPVPRLSSWDDLPEYVNVTPYEVVRVEVSVWWQRYERSLANELKEAAWGKT